MNNFIFENSTKVFFGKGCVKEYLCCLTKAYGDTVMLCYGGGSIKKNGIYDEVTNILEAAGKTVVEFSGIMANPTYATVSYTHLDVYKRQSCTCFSMYLSNL